MDPSSASVPVAEQVSVLPTTTAKEGEMVAVVMVGTVFDTLTLVEEIAVKPDESVAVAVHEIEVPTFTSIAATM